MEIRQLLLVALVVVACFGFSPHRTFAQPAVQETREDFKLFTADTLGDARDKMASYSFEDAELREIMVDSRKTLNAVLFRVKRKQNNIIAIDIYVARPRETRVEFRKTLASPNADLAALASRLKL